MIFMWFFFFFFFFVLKTELSVRDSMKRSGVAIKNSWKLIGVVLYEDALLTNIQWMCIQFAFYHMVCLAFYFGMFCIVNCLKVMFWMFFAFTLFLFVFFLFWYYARQSFFLFLFFCGKTFAKKKKYHCQVITIIHYVKF